MDNKLYNVAVVGATGNVGQALLQVLQDRKFPINNIDCLASAKSVNKKIRFRDTNISVQDLSTFDFSNTDIALFSPGSAISEKFAPIAAKQGCIVIDNTSFFRMKEDVPLIVPEVNIEDIHSFNKTNIIANPNCSTAQMLVPLAPLHREFGIKRIVVSTYQSVSGAGKSGMDELYYNSKNTFEPLKHQPSQHSVFSKEIAFNCIPHIDKFMPNGDTKEEWKMIVETKKILGKEIEVSATCVRVPVFVGHAESINVEFNKEVESIENVRDILESAEGILVQDRLEDEVYATNRDCVKRFPVYVSRLRMDESKKNTVNMWVVADNVYGKGAALNAVQIAESLIEKSLI